MIEPVIDPSTHFLIDVMTTLTGAEHTQIFAALTSPEARLLRPEQAALSLEQLLRQAPMGYSKRVELLTGYNAHKAQFINEQPGVLIAAMELLFLTDSADL